MSRKSVVQDNPDLKPIEHKAVLFLRQDRKIEPFNTDWGFAGAQPQLVMGLSGLDRQP
jgi:hypothetical protein